MNVVNPTNSKRSDTSSDAVYIPWKCPSIIETAQTHGELHSFFMAGEGFTANPGGTIPDKWGDSCLIVFPNGQTMLIDTGMPAYAPVLIENLKRLGVGKLDYLILSHQHDDHTGAIYTQNGLLDHIEVRRAWWSGVYNSNWKDPAMLDKIFSRYNVPFNTLSEGNSLKIGEASIQVFSPETSAGLSKNDTQEINDSSVVMKIRYKNFAALFTGDIHPQKEQELLDKYEKELRADLIKLPHHGNNTSTSDRLARAVSPKLAVATGREFIDPVTIRNYTNTGTVVLLDIFDGYVHAVTDGNDLSWECSRQRNI